MIAPRRNRLDLHTHTARSDGVLEPLALYAQMREWGSTLVAITDHDTLAGARELIAAGLGGAGGPGPRLIVGVEINTVVDDEVEAAGGTAKRRGELHILGLGVDPDDPGFEAVMAEQRGGRERRLRRTLACLRKSDLDVEAHLPRVAGGIDALGRPHVARALVSGRWTWASAPDAAAASDRPGRARDRPVRCAQSTHLGWYPGRWPAHPTAWWCGGGRIEAVRCGRWYLRDGHPY